MKNTTNQTQPVHPLNVILYGPPGTGKTFATYERAVQIADPAFTSSDRDELMRRYEALRQQDQIQFITFHQSYSYEEFIEGIRPELEKESTEPRYKLKDGILKQIADMARTEYETFTTNTANDASIGNKNETKIKNYVLIIDEINRGNISKIFGEAITLLDDDKRLGAKYKTTITLPYSQTEFVLPSNLYILGTMNTADRSIALMDVALRRRFEFEEVMPDASVLEGCLDKNNVDRKLVELVLKVFNVLNKRIEVLLDRDHQIGHSYFLNICNEKDLHKIWNRKIIPLLQEYFYNDRDRLTLLLRAEKDGGFIVDKSEKMDYKALFKDADDTVEFPGEIKRCASPEELRELLKKAF